MTHLQKTAILGITCCVATGKFNENLRLIMERKGLTITDLAKRSGLHYVVISRYVKGDVSRGAKPSIHNLLKLASGLNVSLEELTGAVDKAGLEAITGQSSSPRNEKVAKLIEFYEALDDNDPRKKAINALLGLEPDKEEK